MWHPAVIATLTGSGLVLLGWIAKRVLWDPIDEARKANIALAAELAKMLPREEFEVHQVSLQKQFDTLRVERDAGNATIIRHIDQLNSSVQSERQYVRQDMQNLTKRVDEVMQLASRSGRH